MECAFAAFGVDTDKLAALPKEEEDHCEVWRENWAVVLMFLSLQTQWVKEIPAMASKMLWHGLPYPAVDLVIRANGLRGAERWDAFLDVQEMERAALAILNK